MVPRHRTAQPIHSTHSLANPMPSKRFRHLAGLGKRTRGQRNEQESYAPPENWHEPSEQLSQSSEYRIVVQPAGRGFRHVVTPDEIRHRLNSLPAEMVRPLEVIQLSRMTRKKQSFPCYGMQWGTALYLYPIESSLIEVYGRPPKPAQVNEARMYGGFWEQVGPGEWRLVWTEAALKDYYLNNVLIHELGHLLDNRNRSYTDRERYAEWFAIEHGYKHGGRAAKKKRRRSRVVRRHHTT